jgi:hypothetical protein
MLKKRIEEIIKSYKLEVEAITKGCLKEEFAVNFEITISTGSNEGYYVSITEGCIVYHLRMHSKNEALKILGCMLILLPNN